MVSKSMVVTHVYHSYFVLFVGLQTWLDFIILNMLYFDVFLGMTWNLYIDIFNCNTKKVTLNTPNMIELQWERVYKVNPVKII